MMSFCLFAPRADAQEGNLIDMSKISFSDGQVSYFERRIPEFENILEQVQISRISYLSDGLDVKGYLLIPRDGEAMPAVIYNRGGNREFGALTDTTAALRLAPVAAWGYVVIASQYRGNAGGEGQEEFGGNEINDVLNLIPLLESLPQVDATRIGMYGWSRGGMMTYLALSRTGRIRAAIIGAGMANSYDTVTRRPEMEQYVYSELVPGWEENRESALEARSAVRWPEYLNKETPILLLHGSSDWRVHPSQALEMADALYHAKHPFRFVFFEGGDHALSEHRAEVNRLVKDWLDRYVRDGASWPSLEPHGR
jgi:dipeptidyl aminopeptidase/acylaminoacyl peptidase